MTEMSCSKCRRPLGDIQPQFLEVHPQPVCGPCAGYEQPAGLPSRSQVLAELDAERWSLRFNRLRLRWSR